MIHNYYYSRCYITTNTSRSPHLTPPPFHTVKPHNPMINAGALILCSLVKQSLPINEKVNFVSCILKHTVILMIGVMISIGRPTKTYYSVGFLNHAYRLDQIL